MLVPMRMFSLDIQQVARREPEFARPERHDLHQADRACRRHGERIEGALDVDDREHELRAVAQHCVLARLAMHGAQDPLRRRADVVAEPQVRRLLRAGACSTRGCITAYQTTSSYLSSKQGLLLIAAAMT